MLRAVSVLEGKEGRGRGGTSIEGPTDSRAAATGSYRTFFVFFSFFFLFRSGSSSFFFFFFL